LASCFLPLQPQPQSGKTPIYNTLRKFYKLHKGNGLVYSNKVQMALSIQQSTDFTASNVVFSKLRKNKNGGKAVYLNGPGGRKINLEIPKMRAPFGLSTFMDEATKKTTYTLPLSFDSEPEIQDLMERMKALDELIIKTVADNSQEWLGKKYGIPVIKEALYKPIITPGKGDYPSTMKLKVQHDSKTGEFVPEAYNHQRENVDMTSIEKGQKVTCIIDINQIWFVDNKFGVSVRLLQVLLEPSKKLPRFAFKNAPAPAEEVDEGEEEYEEEEVDE